MLVRSPDIFGDVGIGRKILVRYPVSYGTVGMAQDICMLNTQKRKSTQILEKEILLNIKNPHRYFLCGDDIVFML